MLKVAALLNWGMGLEVLKTLRQMTGVNVEFVVTREPSGGGDPWERAVRDFAGDVGCPCFDEGRLSFDELRALVVDRELDLIICHAYRRILPEQVFAAPRLGSLNIHCSLLPKYRGPSPHHWIFKNKETKTGITYHLMDEGIDTGPIVHQEECEIAPEEGLEALLGQLKTLVGSSLPEAIHKLSDPQFHPLPQNHDLATYAPRPSTN